MPGPSKGAGWLGEGPPLSAPDARGAHPFVTGEPPRAVLPPPQSSPGSLPPRSEVARKANPNDRGMGPQGGGRRRPVTP